MSISTLFKGVPMSKLKKFISFVWPSVLLVAFYGVLLCGLQKYIYDGNDEAEAWGYRAVKKTVVEHPSLLPLLKESMRDGVLSKSEARQIFSEEEILEEEDRKRERAKAKNDLDDFLIETQGNSL
jgi:hypothetical protein